MTVVYLLAHFDDEYGVLPLIRQRAEAGIGQRFVYLADYETPALATRRRNETRAFMVHLGLNPDHVIHLQTGVVDGRLRQDLPRVFDAVQASIEQLGHVERLVVPAWEGGHPDHEACAQMAVALQRRSLPAATIEQFSLYHGKGLAGPLFRACDPITENGPVVRVGLSAKQWLDYAASIRFFGSQARTWAGLWPSMFLTFALRGGFGYQNLNPERIHERPHSGPLLYERMYGVSYDEVRRAGDVFLAGL